MLKQKKWLCGAELKFGSVFLLVFYADLVKNSLDLEQWFVVIILLHIVRRKIGDKRTNLRIQSIWNVNAHCEGDKYTGPNRKKIIICLMCQYMHIYSPENRKEFYIACISFHFISIETGMALELLLKLNCKL